MNYHFVHLVYFHLYLWGEPKCLKLLIVSSGYRAMLINFGLSSTLSKVLALSFVIHGLASPNYFPSFTRERFWVCIAWIYNSRVQVGTEVTLEGNFYGGQSMQWILQARNFNVFTFLLVFFELFEVGFFAFFQTFVKIATFFSNRFEILSTPAVWGLITVELF